MPENSRPESLLEELEALQDHVLTELDRLNDRILLLLKEVAPPAATENEQVEGSTTPGIVFLPSPIISQPQMV